jgi:triphosphatase
MQSNSHQTIIELTMSENGGAGDSSRAVAQRNRDHSLRAQNRTENALALTKEMPEPCSEQVADAAGIPLHEARDVSLPGAAAPRASEIELKLLVDADRLADFNDAPIVATKARNKGTRKHLKSVYYDTPERTLWHNGLSLRVRQSGARFVQTVKTEFEDNPLQRGEWEANVASTAPDVALALPLIPAKLRSDLGRHQLEAVFTADIHRHQRVIDLPSGTVEVAFDHGVLKSGDRSMPVSEIELELKDGSAGAIYELAERLAEHGSVRPSIRSKAARGFDLAADTPPPARKPQKLRLDPSVPLDDAFATILRSCLRHLLDSLPAAEDGRNPEGIHQLRVSLRRLRSALDLMRSVGSLSKLESLRSDARWLAQNVSTARDWDIFQTETLPTIAKACSSVVGFDALGEATEKRRGAAYAKARFVLVDRRCSSFVIELGGWIEARGWRGDLVTEDLRQLAEPTINFASRILAGQHAKVLKRGRHFKSLTPEKRHRLRIAVKKLRYHADFLLPLYGQRKSAKRFSDRLAGLQDELGAYNDMATTASLLGGLDAVSSDSFTASAAITGWQAHAMTGAEARLRDAWRGFAKTKVPWSKAVEGVNR